MDSGVAYLGQAGEQSAPAQPALARDGGQEADRGGHHRLLLIAQRLHAGRVGVRG